MMVARAAPIIPQWSRNIATGSRMILIIHPARVDSIAKPGLPSARIPAFIELANIKKGIPATIYRKYSCA